MFVSVGVAGLHSAQTTAAPAFIQSIHNPHFDLAVIKDSVAHDVIDYSTSVRGELVASFVTIHWYATGPFGAAPTTKIVHDLNTTVIQGSKGNILLFEVPTGVTSTPNEKSFCEVSFNFSGKKLQHTYSPVCFTQSPSRGGLSLDVEIETLFK